MRAGIWVTLCVLITAAAAGVYIIGQQAGRLGADDVPRALATRAAEKLSKGLAPAQALGALPVDLGADSTPFVIVYDQAHHILASGATVAGEPPTLPSGVLDAAATEGENHVSWQPRPGIREAVVALPWGDGRSSGVVVAGASLQPTETRSHTLLGAAALGWLMLVSAVTLVVLRVNRSPLKGLGKHHANDSRDDRTLRAPPRAGGLLGDRGRRSSRREGPEASRRRRPYP